MSSLYAKSQPLLLPQNISPPFFTHIYSTATGLSLHNIVSIIAHLFTHVFVAFTISDMVK